jgi:flagellar basal-body rod modification protein FlgD
MLPVTATTPYSITANVNATGNGVDAASTTTTGDSTSTGTGTKTQTLGKDDFLKLLLTQMRYQDPLNPMDNTQFVTQLAQFQSLEGTNNIQSAIENLNTSFKASLDAQKQSADSMLGSAAISLIGKTVRVQQKNLAWSGTAGDAVNIPISLGNNNTATVQIVDSSGAVVKTLTASGKDSNNTVVVKWDGGTDTGLAAPSGSYTVNVVGGDTDSSLYAFSEGKVDGVSNLSNGAQVRIGGLNFSVGDIVDVSA